MSQIDSAVPLGSPQPKGDAVSVGNGREYIVSLKKTLRMLRRLEALHPALSLAGRLMRVLGAIVWGIGYVDE